MRDRTLVGNAVAGFVIRHRKEYCKNELARVDCRESIIKLQAGSPDFQGAALP